MKRAKGTGPSVAMRSRIHSWRGVASDCGCITSMIYFAQSEGQGRPREGEIYHLATLIVCPRCRGAVQPDAHACPRCGLVLEGLAPEATSASVSLSQGGSP